MDIPLFTGPISVNLSRDHLVLLIDYPAWTFLFFGICLLKQPSTAYHPEVGHFAASDQFYQLHQALNTLKQLSVQRFIPFLDISFYENSIA